MRQSLIPSFKTFINVASAVTHSSCSPSFGFPDFLFKLEIVTKVQGKGFGREEQNLLRFMEHLLDLQTVHEE